MKLDIEHINQLLDDYEVNVSDYHSHKGKSESNYLKILHDRREEIDNYFMKFNSMNSNTSLGFILNDLMDTINNLSLILKNDLDALDHHKKDDPAVFLLNNYRQHLIFLVDKYSKKLSL